MTTNQSKTDFLGGIAKNGTKFIVDTVAISKTNPMAGGGRCLGMGVLSVVGGIVISTVGGVAETLGVVGMVLSGISMMNGDKGSGKLFVQSAGLYAAGAVAQVGGTVAIVGGGVSLAAGTGLVAYGARRNMIQASSARSASSARKDAASGSADFFEEAVEECPV